MIFLKYFMEYNQLKEYLGWDDNISFMLSPLKIQISYHVINQRNSCTWSIKGIVGSTLHVVRRCSLCMYACGTYFVALFEWSLSFPNNWLCKDHFIYLRCILKILKQLKHTILKKLLHLILEQISIGFIKLCSQNVTQ